MTRAGLAAAAVLALAVGVEVLAHGDHAGGFWHAIPGFHFVFGLLACYAIVVLSKGLGRLGIQQPDGDEWEP